MEYGEGRPLVALLLAVPRGHRLILFTSGVAGQSDPLVPMLVQYEFMIQ